MRTRLRTLPVPFPSVRGVSITPGHVCKGDRSPTAATPPQTRGMVTPPIERLSRPVQPPTFTLGGVWVVRGRQTRRMNLSSSPKHGASAKKPLPPSPLSSRECLHYGKPMRGGALESRPRPPLEFAGSYADDLAPLPAPERPT